MRLSWQSEDEQSMTFVTLFECCTGCVNTFFQRSWILDSLLENLLQDCRAMIRKIIALLSAGSFKVKLRDDTNFISKVIIGDESQVYGYYPKTKKQTLQWKSPNSPQMEKHIRSTALSSPRQKFFWSRQDHPQRFPLTQSLLMESFTDVLR